MGTKYNKTNIMTNSLYTNMRPQSVKNINFKPSTYNKFNTLQRPVLSLNGQISYSTQGTKSTKGVKTSPDTRISMLIDTSNTNKFHWDADVDSFEKDRNVKVFGNMNNWLESVEEGNHILPTQYPPPRIFDKNMCKSSSSYHSPVQIELDNNSQKKPKWGTPIGYDVKGPRKMNPNYTRTNTRLPFDATHSGYIVQKQESFIPSYSNYKKETYKDNEDKPFCSRNNMSCKKIDKEYVNNQKIYKGECGSKFENEGTILEKNIKDPHMNYFVKHNIIGLNKKDKNEPGIFMRNIGKYNNKELISKDINLNDLKRQSHSNFINNTNLYRNDVNHQLFEQKTTKMSRNLDYRG